jgi:hypothetical protein
MPMKYRLAIGICALYGAMAVFSAPRPETEKSLLVIVKGGRYGFIDHDGRTVTRPRFLWADDFMNGADTVYVCGCYLFIDSSGTLLPLRRSYGPGQLRSKKKEGKVGFVDAAGNFRIEPIYDETLPFSGGFAAVRIADKWGFIDTTGRMTIQPQFSSAFYFRKGVPEVIRNRIKGFPE